MKNKNYDRLCAFLCALFISTVCVWFSKSDIVIIMFAVVALIFLAIFLITTKYYIANFKLPTNAWISSQNMKSFFDLFSQNDSKYVIIFRISWLASFCMLFGTIYVLWASGRPDPEKMALSVVIVLFYGICSFLISLVFLLKNENFYTKDLFDSFYKRFSYIFQQEIILTEEEQEKYKKLKKLENKIFEVYVLEEKKYNVINIETGRLDLEKLVHFIGKDIWNNEVEIFKKPLEEAYQKMLLQEKANKESRAIAQRILQSL